MLTTALDLQEQEASLTKQLLNTLPVLIFSYSNTIQSDDEAEDVDYDQDDVLQVIY